MALRTMYKYYGLLTFGVWVYSTISTQDRLLFLVIFTHFWLFYFPGYNAIKWKPGNIETVWAIVLLYLEPSWPHRIISIVYKPLSGQSGTYSECAIHQDNKY